MGKDEELIIEQCYRTNRQLPERVANAPELLPGLELYWVAYQDLSTCRPAGFGGAYPIPYTAILDWATASGLDEEQVSTLVRFIRKMDVAFLKWYEENHGNEPQRKTIQSSHVGPS